jgi:hypothetical protein
MIQLTINSSNIEDFLNSSDLALFTLENIKSSFISKISICYEHRLVIIKFKNYPNYYVYKVNKKLIKELVLSEVKGEVFHKFRSKLLVKLTVAQRKKLIKVLIERNKLELKNYLSKQ